MTGVIEIKTDEGLLRALTQGPSRQPAAPCVYASIDSDFADPINQQLEAANGTRQYDFLRSLVSASVARNRTLSESIIKALNFQGVACLYPNPGEYRSCWLPVGDDYLPPEHHRVGMLMEDFVNVVNRQWDRADPVLLAACVLWKLNWIHPFINGNGRTARAASYFVLCVKSGRWLPGTTILPELIRRERAAYLAALRAAHASFAKGAVDLSQLHALLSVLLKEQLASAACDGATSTVRAACRSQQER